MKTVKVDVIQVFSGKNDIRKYLNLDLYDEDKEYFEEEYDIDERTLNEILSKAKMWVNMSQAMNEQIELVVREEAE